MNTVDRLLQTKSPEVWVIAPEDSVFEAIKVMADKSIGALPVVQNNKLVGIVSERDYARKVILKNRSSKETPVRDIMTRRVVCVNPMQDIEACMALMNAKKIRHLPVMEQDRLVGMISIGDVIRDVISEREHTIQQLENYIMYG